MSEDVLKNNRGNMGKHNPNSTNIFCMGNQGLSIMTHVVRTKGGHLPKNNLEPPVETLDAGSLKQTNSEVFWQ